MIAKILIAVCVLFVSSVSASQDPESQSSFDPVTKLLKIPVVKVADRYWSAELVDQGEYRFQLKSTAGYTKVIPDVFPTFDAISGVLNIPNLSAFGQVWAVTLKNRGDFTFKLDTATEVITSPPINPIVPDTLPPQKRYQINNDGTVTDTVTHLQWMRCSHGKTWNGKTCNGNLIELSMQEAAYAAFQSNFAGHADWRLPNVDELKTLVYCSSKDSTYWNNSGRACSGNFLRPTIYTEAFPDEAPVVYWTSTQLQADPGEDYNLTVSFNYGHVFYSYFNDAYEASRFVRGNSNIVPAPEYIGGFKE